MKTLVKLSTVLCLVILAKSLTQFKYYPEYNFTTGGYPASDVKISPASDWIVVGYKNGNAAIYNIAGSYSINLTAHNYPIIDVDWIPGYGPITLDSNGKAIRWSTSGSIIYTWTLNSSVIDMSLSTGSTYYVGFNFGTSIQQFNALTGGLTLNYYPQPYTSFKRFQYGPGCGNVFVSTNTSQIHVYLCTNGSYYSSNYSTNYPAKALSMLSSSQVVIMTTTGSLYKFKPTNSGSYLTSASSYSSMMTTCPDTDLIIEGYSYPTVYTENGYYKQTLYSPIGQIQGLDCSSKYLVAVNSFGYVSVYSYYSIIPPPSPSDSTGLIVGLIVGFFVFCLIVCFIIKVAKRKRRRAAMNAMNGYNNFDNQVPPSQPYFANNQGYNPNPGRLPPNPIVYKVNQHQIYNNYPPQQQEQPINPYQANQPRNWE